MQPIISPVDKELLKAELTPERRLRSTNKAGNEIYIITYHQAPNVMREIGRLREIAFRAAGGGTDWNSTGTNSTPASILTTNSSCGTLRKNASWGDTASCRVRKFPTTRTDNRCWLQATCFTSRTNSCRPTWLIPLNWGGRS